MPNSADIYGLMGSVPDKTDTSGSGARPLSVRANANDFGAQIGAATEKFGAEAQQQVDHFGGMILETAANDAEVGFTKAAGAIKAKYSQYSGLQAEAMRPHYEAELQEVRNQYGANLPLKAQHAYDINTNKSVAFDTAHYDDYAAGQVKAANTNSQTALMDTAVARTGDLNTVLNDKQFGEQVLAPIVHGGNALADINGYSALATGQDAETGHYTYPDTPEGNAAKAAHMAVTNGKLAAAYTTGAQTIADNQGVQAAADWSQKHWADMPDAAKVQINKFLAPKMKNEFIAGSIANMNSKIQTDYSTKTSSDIPASPLDDASVVRNSLDVIRKNEGEGYSKDSKGEVVNGINSLAFPKEFAEAKHILDTQGQAAATKYADNFYQKNIIEKYGVSSLPPATQAIVADGLVNHGGVFGKTLISAAEDGASPQELIDMRRKEYARLNATGKPEYANSFKGWNARLDNLEKQQNGAFPQALNKADYLRENQETYVKQVVDAVDEKYGDYYLSQMAERRARAQITTQIKEEDHKLKSDRDMIDNAIGGAMTKGQPISTHDELNSLPGIAPVLQRVSQEQGEYFQSIDVKIAKAAHADAVTNSANGYDAILNALDSQKFPRQARIEFLSKGLGSDNPGYSITWKDFNDAKPAVDLPAGGKFISDQMKEIAAANGNIDGMGQQRAVQWYNQTMKAWRDASAGEKPMKPQDFFNRKNVNLPAINNPSRMEQINATAQKKSIIKNSAFDYDSVKSGEKYTAPDGSIRTKR